MTLVTKQRSKKNKILIIEGPSIKKKHLNECLNNTSNFNIIGAISNINNAFYTIAISEPEVILVDLSYIGSKSIETIERIKEISKSSKIIILSKDNNKNKILDLIRAGINAYCFTDISIDSLSLIIKTVAKGACWFDPIAVPTLFSSISKKQ